MKLKNPKLKSNVKYGYDICGFQQFERIRPFGDNIYAGKISINKAEMDQTNLLDNVADFI